MQKQLQHDRLLPLILAPLLCWSSGALAEPGDHIRAGDAEITPSVGLTGGWRSNVYLQEGEIGGGEPVTSGAYLELRPAIEVEIDNEDVKFGFDGAYAPRVYLSPELANLNRFTFFDLGARLNLFPKAVVGVKLQDNFTLSGRENEAVTADWAYLTVLTNYADGFLSVRPGSSMEFDLGGLVDFRDYRTDAGTNPLVTTEAGAFGLAALNQRLAYGPAARFTWKFLPKTAVIVDFQRTWFYWKDNFLYAQGDGLGPSASNDFNTYLGIPDGKDLRIFGGLRGRFTDKLLLGLQLGLVRMIYDENSVIQDARDNPDVDLGGADTNAAEEGFAADLEAGLGVVAQVGYEVREDNEITVGYRRDFQDIFFSNYVSFHQVTLQYEGMVAERWAPLVAFDWRNETYTGEVARRDNFLRLRTDLTYGATDYLDVNGGVWWSQRASVDTPDDPTLEDANPALEYDDWNVHLGVVFTY